jgi:hypothetical protein
MIEQAHGSPWLIVWLVMPLVVLVSFINTFMMLEYYFPQWGIKYFIFSFQYATLN